MNVILFGSLLNPLSAAAAQYLSEHDFLKLIVIAKSRCSCRGGPVYFLSQLVIGMQRYFHMLLRIMRIKQSKNYLSLLEFIIDKQVVPKIYFQRDAAGFEHILNEKLKSLKLEQCIAVSCIFPWRIPVSLPGIEKIINIHPAELPTNKGINPYFWTLAKNMNFSGITYHILTEEIDGGPILFKEKFPINSCFSEYRLEKISVGYLKRSLPFLFERVEYLWANAQPQGRGRYYPEPVLKDRKKYRRHSVFYMSDFYG